MSDSHYPTLRAASKERENCAIMDGSETCNNSSSSTLNREISSSGASSNFREVDHTLHLLAQVSALLLNTNNADITFLVQDERVPAHRVILAIRSDYFRAMLYGGMRESVENVITMNDTPLPAFKMLLTYIYTGKLQLHTMTLELLLDLLALVHRYGFTELETAIPDYLKSILNNRIVCQIYATSFLYSIESLMSACLDYIDNFALEILSTKGFLQLSSQAMVAIISRNSFCAPEVEIFNAVKRWIKSHPDEPDSNALVLSNVRFSLIKLTDLLNIVRPSGLVSAEQLLDTIAMQSTTRSSDLHYRGFILPGVNVATASLNAKAITGDYKTALFMATGADGAALGNGNVSFTNERPYTRHSINPRDPNGITIELSRLFILNNIHLYLLDRDQRAYSYYIELSVDRSDWVRVVDRTTYFCCGFQNLYFQERVVKFIRVVGTQATMPGHFQIVNFEAMYSTEAFELDSQTTLQIPHHNVATIKNNALVSKGVSRSRDALLNEDTKNYDWDNGYTCHQIGEGAIEIQLPQPYLLDSMKLLLWDIDDRVYSYYIEVSCDKQDWKKIAEHGQQRSWQTLTFERMPIMYVRIVGTYNSANEVFHCVHFESPAVTLETDENFDFNKPSTSDFKSSYSGQHQLAGQSDALFQQVLDQIVNSVSNSNTFFAGSSTTIADAEEAKVREGDAGSTSGSESDDTEQANIDQPDFDEFLS